MKTEEIAQWVIDNRYPKSEQNKVSDAEMYHILCERITKQLECQQERMYGEEDMKQFGLYLGEHFKKLRGKTIDEIFEQFKKQ